MIRPLTTKPWLASLALVALALTLSVSVALADDGKSVKVRTIVLEGDDAAMKLDGHRIIVMDDEDLALGDGAHWTMSGDDDATWTMAAGGAWLGVQVRELGEQLGAYFGAKDGGALVESVVEDSPAAKAGFQAGDVILALGGEPVADPDDVITTVRGMAKGDQLEAKVLRKGKEMTLKAELAEREGGAAVVRAMGQAPHALQLRKFRSGGPEHEEIMRLHRELAPRAGMPGEEIENLHADIAELRAMIDELREKMAEQK
jgi:membrane-associated protease RseP (regulator of RpoE activity)